jgi:hypothetical protein
MTSKFNKQTQAEFDVDAKKLASQLQMTVGGWDDLEIQVESLGYEIGLTNDGEWIILGKEKEILATLEW